MLKKIIALFRRKTIEKPYPPKQSAYRYQPELPFGK